MATNRYVLITPAKNEEAFIESAIKSIVAQTVLPLKWVIVDDGSIDRTAEIVEKYLPFHRFMQLVRFSEPGARNFGSKARAIQAGFEQLSETEYEFYGNLDADVTLPPNYYEHILAQFQRNPKLGIAGGIILEDNGGQFESRFATTVRHVAGAVQFFRRQSFAEIGGYLQLKSGGMDAIAIEMARMRGWEVRAFPEMKVLHHRHTGTAGMSIYRGRIAEGKEDYTLGYHPMYFLAKCLYRMVESPYLIGSVLRLYGYCRACVQRDKREIPQEVVAYMRQRQIDRLFSSWLCSGSRQFSKKRPATKTCMMAYAHYSSDGRIRREAEALIARGDEVDCISLHEPNRRSSRLNGVRVYRLPVKKYQGDSTILYVAGYFLFFLFAFASCTWLYLRKRYDLIHVHNMPDFLVFAAVVPRLCGARIVVDLHDLMPDLFMSKFGVDEQNAKIRLLARIERFCIAFADRAIAVHQQDLELLVQRGNPVHKLSTLLNVPDPGIFTRPAPRKPQTNSPRLRLIYHGTVAKRTGLEVALRAAAEARKDIPNLEFSIIGGGDWLQHIRELSHELNLEDCMRFYDFVPVEQLPAFIREADLGIVPYLNDHFTRYVLPVKLLEYVAMKIPVIASRLETLARYFDDTMLRYTEPGNHAELAGHIVDLYRHPHQREQLVLNAERFNQAYNWNTQKQQYFDLIDSILKKAE